MTCSWTVLDGLDGSWHYPHKIGSPYGTSQPVQPVQDRCGGGPTPPPTWDSSEPSSRAPERRRTGPREPRPPVARPVRPPLGPARPAQVVEAARTCSRCQTTGRPVVSPAAAARRRLRHLALERAAVGELEFERRQLQRARERIERCRARTAAAVARRQTVVHVEDCLVLPLEDPAPTGRDGAQPAGAPAGHVRVGDAPAVSSLPDRPVTRAHLRAVTPRNAAPRLSAGLSEAVTAASRAMGPPRPGERKNGDSAGQERGAGGGWATPWCHQRSSLARRPPRGLHPRRWTGGPSLSARTS